VFAHRDFPLGEDIPGAIVARWFRRPYWEHVADAPDDPLGFAPLVTRALDAMHLGPQDHVYFQFPLGRDLEDLIEPLRRLPAQRRPKFHFRLHYGPDDPGMRINVRTDPGQILRALAATGPVGATRFHATTLASVRAYSQLGAPFVEWLPLCSDIPELPEPPWDERTPRPLHLMQIGHARPGKGYKSLLHAIERLYDSHIATGALRFTIHAGASRSDPISDLDRLRAYPESQIRLSRESLPRKDYLSLLAMADAVILPYGSKGYATNGSAVVVEAIVAGKPVIVPAGTTLAELPDPRQTVIFDPAQGEDGLVNAILALAKDFPRYREAALAAAPEKRRAHSCAAMLERIMG
jgi:glycosyltransferase involved in cell wall biosynthesis